MHSANADKSARLARTLEVLRAFPEGATTWDIQCLTNSMAPSTDVAGLRQNGYDVICKYDGKTFSSSVGMKQSEATDVVRQLRDLRLIYPDGTVNDLARKAAANPAALSQEEWETWYCTAYPSSIAYQIEEVIPGAVAKQVRQVAALQGNVLQKTQAVMILMTVLSLIAAAVAVANLMVASVGERSGELALLKALGATDAAVSRLMLAETAAISLLGAIVGALLGSGVAQLIGRVVFGSGITMRPMVFVLVFVLLAVTVLLASASSIRSILNLKPAEVLHGR